MVDLNVEVGDEIAVVHQRHYAVVITHRYHHRRRRHIIITIIIIIITTIASLYIHHREFPPEWKTTRAALLLKKSHLNTIYNFLGSTQINGVFFKQLALAILQMWVSVAAVYICT